MAALKVTLTGNFITSPGADCSSSDTTTQRSMVLGIKSETQSAAACIGQGRYTVTGVTNEVLAFPVAFSARLLVLRVVSGSLAVRITHAGAGQTTVQVNGLFALEVTEAERITAVDVTGSATFEWAATGPNSV